MSKHRISFAASGGSPGGTEGYIPQPRPRPPNRIKNPTTVSTVRVCLFYLEIVCISAELRRGGRNRALIWRTKIDFFRSGFWIRVLSVTHTTILRSVHESVIIVFTATTPVGNSRACHWLRLIIINIFIHCQWHWKFRFVPKIIIVIIFDIIMGCVRKPNFCNRSGVSATRLRSSRTIVPDKNVKSGRMGGWHEW